VRQGSGKIPDKIIFRILYRYKTIKRRKCIQDEYIQNNKDKYEISIDKSVGICYFIVTSNQWCHISRRCGCYPETELQDDDE
jgi:hypothetical protein